MAKKRITRRQACNRDKCPACGSKNIRYEDSGCRCNCHPSCWSHPVCMSCGLTGDGNSEGGIWISFSELGAATHYEIDVRE